jgi:uncharacterized protein (DUF1697 family)
MKLEAYAGKRLGVLVRTAVEMEAVLKENPFPQAAPSRTVAIFLDKRCFFARCSGGARPHDRETP